MQWKSKSVLLNDRNIQYYRKSCFTRNFAFGVLLPEFQISNSFSISLVIPISPGSTTPIPLARTPTSIPPAVIFRPRSASLPAPAAAPVSKWPSSFLAIAAYLPPPLAAMPFPMPPLPAATAGNGSVSSVDSWAISASTIPFPTARRWRPSSLPPRLSVFTITNIMVIIGLVVWALSRRSIASPLIMALLYLGTFFSLQDLSLLSFNHHRRNPRRLFLSIQEQRPELLDKRRSLLFQESSQL